MKPDEIMHNRLHINIFAFIEIKLTVHLYIILHRNTSFLREKPPFRIETLNDCLGDMGKNYGMN